MSRRGTGIAIPGQLVSAAEPSLSVMGASRQAAEGQWALASAGDDATAATSSKVTVKDKVTVSRSKTTTGSRTRLIRQPARPSA